ncbi:Ubiquitin carboxyl-terminal hydrolase family protein [Quillaja saponaria]|uniref:Ubiquitin carboxyl-terminal hydrolase family protein n=1 Tax=Quillaja saponaria TaxID=32244 RepID=A0AAD7L9U9_QUISA|nr:Ubiquitin carboxyl-terminal hydrolase family protein [Quillaja saponaria]
MMKSENDTSRDHEGHATDDYRKSNLECVSEIDCGIKEATITALPVEQSVKSFSVKISTEIEIADTPSDVDNFVSCYAPDEEEEEKRKGEMMKSEKDTSRDHKGHVTDEYRKSNLECVPKIDRGIKEVTITPLPVEQSGLRFLAIDTIDPFPVIISREIELVDISSDDDSFVSCYAPDESQIGFEEHDGQRPFLKEDTSLVFKDNKLPTTSSTNEYSSEGRIASLTPQPSGEMVDFHGMCQVDKSFLILLEEACARNRQMIDCQMRHPLIFRQFAYASLGQMLFLLKYIKIKDMVHHKDELELCWEVTKVMKFDLEWLRPVVERALSSTMLLQKAIKTGKRLKGFEEKVIDAKNEIAFIEDKLKSMEVHDVSCYYLN